MNRTVEQRAMRKVYWRILPFTGLLYLICYIDRVNVGFAALTMRQDLGLSQAAFGLGAGTAFFLGYSCSKCRAMSSSTRSAHACGSRAS